MKHRLFRFAWSMLGDPDEARDAVQEVLIRLWDKRTEWAEIRNMDAFAVTITKNHCKDRLRKNRPLRLEEDEYKDSNTPDPLRLAEATDAAGLIMRLMQQLPQKQRLVMHLHDLEQWDDNEIASLTGMTNEAIRTNLSRARKKIRTLYTQINAHGLENSGKTAR